MSCNDVIDGGRNRRFTFDDSPLQATGLTKRTAIHVDHLQIIESSSPVLVNWYKLSHYCGMQSCSSMHYTFIRPYCKSTTRYRATSRYAPRGLSDHPSIRFQPFWKLSGARGLCLVNLRSSWSSLPSDAPLFPDSSSSSPFGIRIIHKNVHDDRIHGIGYFVTIRTAVFCYRIKIQTTNN